MDTELILRGWLQGEELRKKGEELAQLQSELAEQELALMSLRADLAAFERRYLRVVGTLYIELDLWNKRLVELAQGQKIDPAIAEKWRRKIAELLRDAENEASVPFAVDQFQAEAGEPEDFVQFDTKEDPFTPAPGLKRLYRDLAKRVHPDLAINEADREERQRVMAEVNAAYQRADFETLRKILEDYKDSFEVPDSKGPAAALARLNRQITQVRNRIKQIAMDIKALNESDLVGLKERVEAEALEGHDLLRAMAENISKRIQAARSRYEVGLEAVKEPR